MGLPPGLPNPDPISDQKMSFSTQFLDQALVVQKLDNTYSLFVQWIAQLVSVILFRWIVIYPVNIAIHLLNKRGLVSEAFTWFCKQVKSR